MKRNITPRVSILTGYASLTYSDVVTTGTKWILPRAQVHAALALLLTGSADV